MKKGQILVAFKDGYPLTPEHQEARELAQAVLDDVIETPEFQRAIDAAVWDFMLRGPAGLPGPGTPTTEHDLYTMQLRSCPSCGSIYPNEHVEGCEDWHSRAVKVTGPGRAALAKGFVDEGFVDAQLAGKVIDELRIDDPNEGKCPTCQSDVLRACGSCARCCYQYHNDCDPI